MPEMSDQIQEGIAHLNISARDSTYSSSSLGSPGRFDSAFPRIPARSSNVPPTDEEVEATLDSARMPVLTSNDADMQLAWAQDTLMYVGTAIDNEERLQTTQPARPSTPTVERQLRLDAMNIVGFLADQQHPRAVFMRGMWYEFGRFGIAQDKKEAFRCYARAADRGYARAEYRLGMLYEAANDPAKAMRHYLRGVEAEDSASLYRLGMMTLRGQHGQPQDFYKGVDLVRRSADSVDENAPQGAYVYGMLLSRQLPQIQVPESILPYDEAKARTYIEIAAFHKFAKAQLQMGSAYELAALGCQFDPILSLHYNRLAARQGETEADMALSKWFLVGHEGIFAKNEELAFTFANRAAATGLATAEFAMGYFYELGIYVPKNLDTALAWYRKAAANGSHDAQGRIDGISRKQVLSKNDHEKVALNRIRSQYGSQRGKRPQRFENPQSMPRMTAITEQGTSASQPPRSSSTVPYPLDDRPPTVKPSAPYPLADQPMPGSFPLSRPATAQPERPSSAFSLDPSIRPSSTATTASGHQRIPPGYQGMGRPPPSAMDPRGRPQVNRVASSPAPMGHPMGMQSPTPPHPGQPDRLDIGFVAPVDDRRYRPGGRQASGAPPGQGPAPATSPHGLRHTPSTPSMNRPPRTSSKPELGGRDYSQGGSSTPPVAKPVTPAPAPVAQAPATAPAPAPSAAALQAKKGPKTFEEMGVPATKQGNECVSFGSWELQWEEAGH